MSKPDILSESMGAHGAGGTMRTTTHAPWRADGTHIHDATGRVIATTSGILAPFIATAPETAAERDRLREALREPEAKAGRLIGTFFSACDGRHALGRECDYCLTSSLLADARDALEQVDPR